MNTTHHQHHDSPRRIAVIGLGYVGLPVAVAFAERFPDTVGFDIDETRVGSLQQGEDSTGEISGSRLTASGLRCTSDPTELRDADFFIVAVPTPIDVHNRPDLAALEAATRTVGGALRPGAIVVYESTVYPGVTEDICAPLLSKVSNLERGVDFWVAYSPERINPGDKAHSFERICKVIAAENEASCNVVEQCYGAVIDAPLHRAPSIRVAEAAKLIENTQRDLNIALMNELAMLFERLDLDSGAILAAARTKWNFLPFRPGLVGGHCIGVDPYYLTTLAERAGLHPQVVLAGRRINDGMGVFVAQKTVKRLIGAGRVVRSCRVAVLGVTFKENIRDTRNSRVPSLVRELKDFGVEAIVFDALADPCDVEQQHGLRLAKRDELRGFDAVIVAVGHHGTAEIVMELSRDPSAAIVVDVAGVIDPASLPESIDYWRL